jgi:hypothetical protein
MCDPFSKDTLKEANKGIDRRVEWITLLKKSLAGLGGAPDLKKAS